MKLKDVILEKKDVIMTIRTSRENALWMAQHEVSPTRVFRKALEELREQNK